MEEFIVTRKSESKLSEMISVLVSSLLVSITQMILFETLEFCYLLISCMSGLFSIRNRQTDTQPHRHTDRHRNTDRQIILFIDCFELSGL